jgi:hypothetical protein
MGRRGPVRLIVLAGAIALALIIGRRLPRDQTVHYVLGDRAPRVEAVEVRWAQARADAADRGGGIGSLHPPSAEDWTRQATFRYAAGEAPRVLTHALRLADGEYTVEVEIVYGSPPNSLLQRHVTLSGGIVSIDGASDGAERASSGDLAAGRVERAALRSVHP